MDEKQKKENAAKTLSMVSMVLGIASIVGVFCCMPFVFSAIGITLAILSKGASGYYSNQAKAGLICSVIGLIASFILTVFIIVVEFMMLFSNNETGGTFWDNFEQKYEQQYEEIYGQELPEEMKDLFNDLKNKN